MLSPQDLDFLNLMIPTNNPNQHILQLTSNPIISIPHQDTQDIWIERWIKDPHIKKELTDLYFETANLTELTFYTDGSLQTQPNNNLRHLPIEERITTVQSAAFIEINTSIRYTSRISNWPSSTRAELYAIFLALIICRKIA